MSERLTDLIERLEKAARGSRELDADICEALDYVVKRNATRTGPKWTRAYAYLDRSRWCAMEHLTTSIDAALALVERVRPGWASGFDSGPKTCIAFIDPHDFADRIGGGRYLATAKTAPLAILAALLRSIEGGERG